MSYIALVLDEHSKKVLLEMVPPIFSNVYADHITIWYNPTPEIIAHWQDLIDSQDHVEFDVTGYANDDCGQAVTIVQYDMGPEEFSNEFPHITISTRDGYRPAYSNILLKNRAGKMVYLSMGLCGTIKLLQ